MKSRHFSLSGAASDGGDSREIFSVTDVTRAIREALEGRFSEIWVEGEISNYRPHSSGHHYFTLKDARSQLSCVLFRGQAARLNFRLQDGQKIQVRGDISVYEARGQYQMIVRWLQPKGFGELQARFEELKRLLDAEGLFDSKKKKPIPKFPTAIAIVTSPTGAAIQDILNVIRRRAPWMRTLVIPVRVQGEGADREIAAAIQEFDESNPNRPEVDTVIVGRGGGGIEDLWSFNEERVARAIAACPIPVISAVGHEIDFTIADFVADLRAPTPSAAAELAVPDGREMIDRLDRISAQLDSRSEEILRRWQERLRSLRRALDAREPRSFIDNSIQHLDHLCDRLDRSIEASVRNRLSSLGEARERLKSARPAATVSSFSERCRSLFQRLESARGRRFDERIARLGGFGKTLAALSPQAVFSRGFSMTTDSQGNLVTRTDLVKKGDSLVTRVARGKIKSIVD